MSQQQKKIKAKYKSKYEMNISSLLQFMQQKVQVDSFSMGLIKDKLSQFQIQGSFKDQDLTVILRLIGAVQNNHQAVQNMTIEQVKEQTKHPLKFKVNKNKKKGQQSSTFDVTQSIEMQYKIQEVPPIKVEDEGPEEIKYEEIEIEDCDQQPKYPQLKQDKKVSNQNSNASSQATNKSKKTEQERFKKIKKQREQDQQEQKLRKQQKLKKQQKLRKQQKVKKQQRLRKQLQLKKQQEQQRQQAIKQERQRNNQRAKQQAQQQKNKQNSVPKKQSLKVVDEQQNSTQFQLRQSQNQQRSKPKFLEFNDNENENKQLVEISKYQKFSTDYVNTVIKYILHYKGSTVYRRYSEFEKLMNFLSSTYQGFILPELPPKQGIKGGMSYFKGIDEGFLNERKDKLESMLNQLLDKKFMKDDSTLQKFLTDQNYEIQSVEQGYGSYLKTITDIAFNAKQLKDYGVAYCNYLRQKNNVKLNPQLVKKYQEVQELVKIFMELNAYRKSINDNFERRRVLMFEVGIKARKPEDAKFNKSMDLIQQEIKNLNTQYDKYRKLKPRENWLEELLRQKQDDGSRVIQQIQQEKSKLAGRIQKMEQNFSFALDDFKTNRESELVQIGSQLLGWRMRVHP